MQLNLKAIGLAALGILGWVVLLYFLSGQKAEYALGYAIVGVNAVMLSFPVSRMLTGQTQWYSLHGAMIVILCLFYVAAPTVVVYAGMESKVYNRPLSPEQFSRAMAVTSIFILCYFMGYRFGPKRMTLPRRFEWYFADTPQIQSSFNTSAIIVFSIGMLAWLYMFSVGGGIAEHLRTRGAGRGDLIAGAGGYVFHLAKFAYAGALLYLSRNGINLISLAMVGLLGLLLFFFGSRGFAFILFIGALVVYRYRFMNRLPWYVAVGGVAALMFMQIFMRMVRFTGGNIDRALTHTRQAGESVETFVLNALGDFHFIINLAEIIDNMGTRIPWQYGQTLLSFLYIIPSFIWRAADYIPAGNIVYLQYLLPDMLGTVSLSNNLFTEFYMNFGLIGVVVGCALWGVFIRWLSNVTTGNPYRKYQYAYVVYAALLWGQLVQIMKSGVPDLTMLVYFFVPVFIVYLPNFSLLLNPPDESGLHDAESAEGEEYESYETEHSYAHAQSENAGP